MCKRVTVILMSMSVLICLGLVKPAIAATNFFGSFAFTQLFLDIGFMEREVNLDLPDMNLKVGFSSADIPAPGVLALITEAPKTSSSPLGNEIVSDKIQLNWQTNAPESPEFALLTVYTAKCSDLVGLECAFEQSLHGQNSIIKAQESTTNSVRARVKINSSVRVVYIPKQESEVEDPGYMTQGVASWYAYKGCNCAASPDFPKGSYVKVTRTNDPSKSVIVRINDYGPERDIFPDRVIDLDKVAFMQIAPLGAGLTHVSVEPVDTPHKPMPVPQVQVNSNTSQTVADLGWEY
ncbi:hypothetical protein GF391_00070 [Candidatus Uhrbacteria bacterium]|nr:hypothetical protein [Candidatus Uhrbacteria bacterium]